VSLSLGSLLDEGLHSFSSSTTSSSNYWGIIHTIVEDLERIKRLQLKVEEKRGKNKKRKGW